MRLKLLGEPALPLLEESALSKDAEVAARSKKLLVTIREHAAHQAENLLKKGLTSIPRPEFVFYENQRTIEGYRTDVLEAKWPADNVANEKRVQELAGPLGHELLIVHVEDEVVLFWGSNRETLTNCLKLLKSKDPGIDERRKQAAKYTSGDQVVEVHLSFQTLVRLVPEVLGRRKMPEFPATKDFSSFSCELAPTHLILNATFPLSEYRWIAAYWFF